MLEVTAGRYRVGTPSAGDVNGDGRAEIFSGTDHGDVYSINARGELLWATRAGRQARAVAALAGRRRPRRPL
jgi:outer membrane protein assembly factor BamB